MNTYFATFGQGHGYARCYVEIHAESEQAAFTHMRREHGGRWSEMLYTNANFRDVAAQRGHVRLAVMRQNQGSRPATFKVEENPQ